VSRELLENLEEGFDEQLLRKDFEELNDPIKGEERIRKKYSNHISQEIENINAMSIIENGDKPAVASQGLIQTEYDYLDYATTGKTITTLDPELVEKTLHVRFFFLEKFNHPLRINNLKAADRFVPPPKINSIVFEDAIAQGRSVSIGDINAQVTGDKNERVGRNERFIQGPFVFVGKQARMPFIGSEMPDIFGSAIALATMAACHCLAALPRNGVFHDIKRQAALAQETFQYLEYLAEVVLDGRSDKDEILEMWKHNILGTLEPTYDKAMRRAEALYYKGVRTLRTYTPEPGKTVVDTTIGTRKAFGNEIELFAGQIVSVYQAKQLEEYVDAGYLGIAGGGRCTTGLKSGSEVGWPMLSYDLSGNYGKPLFAQGGASDHIAEAFLSGVSGIGVSRAVGGGTIESPGGFLYCVDSQGRLFKIYGGEASKREKFLDGKLMPFGIVSFAEGETTKAFLNYYEDIYPTLAHNLYARNEEAIMALVFRGANSIEEMQAIDPSPIRLQSEQGRQQRGTH
jgi:hypothetical protein